MEERMEGIRFPNLRKEMAKQGHSISDLAKRIGVKEKALTRWLCGKQSMEVYYAVQICKVYDKLVDYLFLREEEI